jgi:ribose transport system substrate-binding protein
MSTMDKRRWRGGTALLLSAVLALGITACGSDDDTSSESAGSGTEAAKTTEASSGVAPEIVERVKAVSTPATDIKVVQEGLEPFEPKPGAKIYNISCDVSIIGCNSISNNIKAGVKALGYDYTRCDVGKTPDGPNRCFTQAINAKPDVIAINAIGVEGAADGYAAAEKAGIPVVALFSGDEEGAGGVDVQVGLDSCTQQGENLADAVTVESDGKANVLFAGEKSQGCSVARQAGFEKRFAESCKGCELKTMQFNAGTMQESLPQQLQAELNQNPDLTWVVGVFDSAAQIATTQIQQAGKQDQISVAGMDADPANIDVMLDKGVQKLDIGFAFAETPWAVADAAARIYSGVDVPKGIAANMFLVTHENTGELPDTKVWDGPEDYQDQFKALWGKQ